MHLFIAVEFVYHLYIADLEALMQKGLIKLRQGKLSEIQFTRLITFYMRELVTGLRRAISANEHLASPLLFSGALSHFSLNLYSVGALYYQSDTLSAGDRVLLYCLIALQIIFAYGAVQAMVKLGNDLVLPGKYSGRVQMFLGGGNCGGCSGGNYNRQWRRAVFLNTKLKILSLYEQFHSQAAFRFTFGPLGVKITSKSVYEVTLLSIVYWFLSNFFVHFKNACAHTQFVLIYNGCLIFIFNLIAKEQHQQQ